MSFIVRPGAIRYRFQAATDDYDGVKMSHYPLQRPSRHGSRTRRQRRPRAVFSASKTEFVNQETKHKKARDGSRARRRSSRWYEPQTSRLDAPVDAPPLYVISCSLWLFMLIPWFPVCSDGGLAFDGGTTNDGLSLVCPSGRPGLVLIIAMILKRMVPNAMFLHFLTLSAL